MQIFYAPEITDNRCLLTPDESRHCIRVLRMVRGEHIILTDGKGGLFDGYISDPNPAGCEVTITGPVSDLYRKNYRLHVAISPLKNRERFEWFVEKSVEIGIDEITPLICKNTEKTGVRTGRLNGVIISAMKQSLKAFLPVLHNPEPFSAFLENKLNGTRMIAHCSRNFSRNRIDEVYLRDEDAVILIGPEGDFSDDEIKMALDAGFRSVQLGQSRLRTETAGIAACHSVYFINQLPPPALGSRSLI
ncbi:MAG: 16S rRNA (uracil(1498)-N(3))-methyltransferase [Bacteroidales bacterium]